MVSRGGTTIYLSFSDWPLLHETHKTFGYVILLAVDKSGLLNTRRMTGYAEKKLRTKLTPSPPLEAPAPAPGQELVWGTRWSNLTRIFMKK